jgi:arylsulfatase A-like enzyme
MQRSAPGEQALRHVISVVAAGAVIGGLNAALGPATFRGPAALWAGAGLVVPVLLPIGVVQALVGALLGRLVGMPAAAGLRARLGTFSESAHRSRVGLTLFGLLAGLALAVAMAGTWLGFPFVSAIQVVKARRVVLVAVVTLCWLAGWGGALVVAPLLRRGLLCLDARSPLPWPRSRSLRVAAYGVLPLLALFIPLVAGHQDELSMLAVPLGAVLFASLDWFFYLAQVDARPKLARTGALLGGATLAAAALAQPWTLQASSAKAACARGVFTAPALRWLRRLTDRDHDGFSALYAGGDCAPSDRLVHPGAVDVPDNGRDENCDGVDATREHRFARPPLFAGKLPGGAARPYNVLWIVIDAVRADHLALYGYGRPTSPELSRLAASSLLFLNAYSPSATTHLSFPAFLIGKNVESMRWEYATDRARVEAAAGQPTIAERLAPLGYRSAAVISPFIAHLPSIVRGFDRVITEHRAAFPHDGQGATGAAIDALGLTGPDAAKPFLLLTYYEDPHMPYDAHGAGEPSFGKADVDLYDGEIAYVDRHLGMLLDYLKLHPDVDQRTVVIVTSDHGEELGERGGTSHGKNCNEESVHVPLLVRIPGLPAARIATRVASVDIVPTILELVGAKASEPELDGRSLLGTLDAAPVDAAVRCAITNQGSTLTGRPFYQQAVRYGDRVLLHDLGTNDFGLYDTQSDRNERTNLAARPEEAARLEELKDLLGRGAGGNLPEKRLVR